MRKIKKIFAALKVGWLFMTGQMDNYILIHFKEDDFYDFFDGNDTDIKIYYVGIDKYMMLSTIKSMGNTITEDEINKAYAEFKNGVKDETRKDRD